MSRTDSDASIGAAGARGPPCGVSRLARIERLHSTTLSLLDRPTRRPQSLVPPPVARLTQASAVTHRVPTEADVGQGHPEPMQSTTTHTALSDLPEVEEFFRQGDTIPPSPDWALTARRMDHQEPIEDDAAFDPARTAAQRERRARYAKRVSIGMVVLALGSAGAIAHSLVGHAEPETVAVLSPKGVAQPPTVPNTREAPVTAAKISTLPVARARQDAPVPSMRRSASSPEAAPRVAVRATPKKIVSRAAPSLPRVSRSSTPATKPRTSNQAAFSSAASRPRSGYQPPTVSFSD